MTDTPTALVTGGSRGIGAATARHLAARGYRVAVNYFSNRAAADQVVKEITADGGSAFAVRGDVRDDDEAAELVRRAAEGGRLDVLVCNAAAAHFTPTPLRDLPWEDFRGKVTDELAAVYPLTQHALAVMSGQGYGQIVYVSSLLAEGPSAPGMIAHGTAKAALNTFAQFVACEAGPLGVNVNVVSPGYVRTEASAGIPAEVQRRIAERTPLGRVAEPDDVARAIGLLVGSDAGFVTGTVLRVDGGAGASRM
ncbi:SDR family oxidoreductase [Streptantibioticus cattleyicolor]|uniref:Oxidoreductase, short chain dehydrogenase/reductase n=1 Tax=Streptantibioticus cattleyicolor (strain ATCC 35852 / DSM 46488 / JCM 4925 / NBRC 14057 / NRRL 8057) TaxID=1003195 RepID=F8JMN2_STREN|nr:SDR family oxidoreductase [Streptantibioticus cattleyicolor]AEW98842.1 Oxidoreductase, short chain dehydrogenase/reductase [Streptantibioticus cattleyicolor NRRL 8057 = DSM 46488]CCB72113.1 Oxidoreductase, short chain dehydrogenase/reductase [Streptantibioticus cattleyicolor NRRL 8057 = DSM 46488]